MNFDSISIPRQRTEKRNRVCDFQENIQRLVEHFNKIRNTQINLQAICDKYGFERRRFYDIVNVLEKIGCSRKIDSDRIIWYGLRNVKKYIKSLVKIHSSSPPNASIQSLLKIEKSLSIVSLTNTYLLSFIVLQTQEINMRELANLLSKYNKSSKSTLCKLYQTTQILRALGIIDPISQQGITRISDEIFAIMKIEDPCDSSSPFSIQSLLNDDNTKVTLPNVLDFRRKLFHEALSV